MREESNFSNVLNPARPLLAVSIPRPAARARYLGVSIVFFISSLVGDYGCHKGRGCSLDGIFHQTLSQRLR